MNDSNIHIHDYKYRVYRALYEYLITNKTETQIARECHISRKTLSKYIRLRHFHRQFPLCRSPKKPAKRLSQDTKQKRLIQKLTKIAQKLSIDGLDHLINKLIKFRDQKVNHSKYE